MWFCAVLLTFLMDSNYRLLQGSTNFLSKGPDSRLCKAYGLCQNYQLCCFSVKAAMDYTSNEQVGLCSNKAFIYQNRLRAGFGQLLEYYPIMFTGIF